MAKFRVRCPNCKGISNIDESLAGKTGRCPGCDTLFRVPPPGGATTAVPASVSPAPRKPTRREGLIRLAQTVAQATRDLAASAFDHPSPLLDAARRQRYEDRFANFAMNMEGAAAAIESGLDMRGKRIVPAHVAGALARMCRVYLRRLPRIEEVCGPDVRARFEQVIEGAALLAADIAHFAVDKRAAREELESLRTRIAEVLDGSMASQPDPRRFTDYPALVQCSERSVGSMMPPEAARRYMERIEELVRAEPDFDLAYLWLAVARNALDDFSGAVEATLEGIQKSKRKGHLCATLADICLKRGHLDLAVPAAVRAVELGTELYVAHHLVAEMLRSYGLRAAALTLRAGIPAPLEDWLATDIRQLAEQQRSDEMRAYLRRVSTKLGRHARFKAP